MTDFSDLKIELNKNVVNNKTQTIFGSNRDSQVRDNSIQQVSTPVSGNSNGKKIQKILNSRRRLQLQSPQTQRNNFSFFNKDTFLNTVDICSLKNSLNPSKILIETDFENQPQSDQLNKADQVRHLDSIEEDQPISPINNTLFIPDSNHHLISNFEKLRPQTTKNSGVATSNRMGARGLQQKINQQTFLVTASKQSGTRRTTDSLSSPNTQKIQPQSSHSNTNRNQSHSFNFQFNNHLKPDKFNATTVLNNNTTQQQQNLILSFEKIQECYKSRDRENRALKSNVQSVGININNSAIMKDIKGSSNQNTRYSLNPSQNEFIMTNSKRQSGVSNNTNNSSTLNSHSNTNSTIQNTVSDTLHKRISIQKSKSRDESSQLHKQFESQKAKQSFNDYRMKLKGYLMTLAVLINQEKELLNIKFQVKIRQ
eukprot:403344377